MIAKNTIWIDVCNSPQVTFMRPFIEIIKESGHRLIVTARDHANTIDLLEQFGVEYTIVGAHYGRYKIAKVFGLFHRTFLLIYFLWPHRKSLKVAFSQSSFYSPLAAKLLGVKCIYTNDNENAQGNILANLLSDIIYVPECWKNSKKLFSKKYKFYKGIKEGIYLWDMVIPHKSNQNKKVYYRPGAMSSAYYKDYSENDLYNLFNELAEIEEIIILCRDSNQKKQLEPLIKKFNNIHLTDNTIDLHTIASTCHFFIGSGGSMVRELAILGVPSISIYRGPSLAVDDFLQDQNLLKRFTTYNFSLDSVDFSRGQTDDLLLLGRNSFDKVLDELIASGGASENINL